MGVTLAVDPSIVKTGYAVLRDDAVLDAGVIRPKTAMSDPKRISTIVDAMILVVRLHSVSILVIEVPPTFSYGRSSRGAKTLNQAPIQKLNWVVGALMVMGVQAGCLVHQVLPSMWKGRGSKVATQLATGIDQEDTADAVGLGRWFGQKGRFHRTRQPQGEGHAR